VEHSCRRHDSSLRGGVVALSMESAILIVTKNRRRELKRAVASALAQTTGSQIIVIDDGSTDGTAEMVASEFPDIELQRSEQSLGYLVQRNRGLRMAGAPIVVLIDDDAEFASRRVVERTLLDFDSGRVGAVAIPHIDVGIDREPRLHAPARGFFTTSEFVGTAVAIRREAFLEVGGFRESFFHQGEERDFCVRLLSKGWVVRVGRAEPIHHYPSQIRDVRRMDLYGRRNVILYAWYNEPFPSVAVRMVEMTAQGLLSGISVGRPGAAVDGILRGYRACWDERHQRRPVSRSVIRVFRRLWKHGPLPFSAIEPQLPPLPAGRRAALSLQDGAVSF
jgi:GT2 family glycosyltransferase